MSGIVTICNPKTNKPFSFLKPYRTAKEYIGAREVTVYTLQKSWSLFFPRILKSLSQKHSELIFSVETKQENRSIAPLLFERTQDILSLTNRGTLQKITVLCQQEDPRLWTLLKTATPFAQSVTLVTRNNSLFDSISEKALQQLGLIVHQRTDPRAENSDLVFLLSGTFELSGLQNGYLINLSDQSSDCNLPTLYAVTNREISTFLAQHPYLQVNPSLLLWENAKITNLIWKYR